MSQILGAGHCEEPRHKSEQRAEARILGHVLAVKNETAGLAKN